MFSKMRKRLTYANVAMTLALVLAMSGGAYAAGKYLITSTKQISPKVLKALKGAAGQQGPVGPVGAVGPAGKAGGPGERGAPGAVGANGANGESVTVAAVPKGAGCKEGGSSLKVGASTTYACNGAEGKAGMEGSPWTAKSMLPAGATETGSYALYATAAAEGEYKVSAISFPVQLARAPSVPTFVHVGEAAKAPCKGTVKKPEVEAPSAGEPANLCVFEGKALPVGGPIGKGGLEGLTSIGPGGEVPETNVTGEELVFKVLPLKEPLTEKFPLEVSAEGTWALTG